VVAVSAAITVSSAKDSWACGRHARLYIYARSIIPDRRCLRPERAFRLWESSEIFLSAAPDKSGCQLVRKCSASERSSFLLPEVLRAENEVKVCAELPGVEAKDVDVSVEGNTLTIKGYASLVAFDIYVYPYMFAGCSSIRETRRPRFLRPWPIQPGCACLICSPPAKPVSAN